MLEEMVYLRYNTIESFPMLWEMVLYI